MKRILGLFGFGAVALAIAGCGGGGKGTGSGGGTGVSSKVAVFVTDAVGNYDHVWVTIRKVEVTGEKSNSTVFEDSVGKIVDLVSLNKDGQQQFALLGLGTAPVDGKGQLKITVSSHLTVFPRGSSEGRVKEFEGSEADIKTLSFPLSAGGRRNLVADFDISRWVENGDRIKAVVAAGDDTQVSLDRQVEQEIEGSVSRLSGSAPNFEFDLSRRGTVVHVVTNSTTAFSNEDGSGSPALSNGSEVHVDGKVDPVTHSVTATSIAIGHGQEAEAEAKGLVTQVATDGFTVTVARAKGFVPSNTSLTVETNDATLYESDRGLSLTKDEFFAVLAVGGEVEAEGAYDETTNTLVARKLSVENETENHAGSAKLIGAVSNVNAETRTFDITAVKWEGTVLSNGATIKVVLNAATEIRNVDLSNLASGVSLEVRGVIEGDTLTASRIRPAKGGGGGGGGGKDD